MDQQPTEVWGIAVMAPKQRPAAEKHCFGDCGKISMAGAINDDLTGGLFVCCQPTCPYEAQVMPNYGSTMSFGKPHTVHLRLLKERDGIAAVGAPLDRNVMHGAAAEPKRPLLRYHGGKWRMAPWILRHLPAHRTYVEPFGGGASVLLQKPRSYAEVYNDLDGEVVNLFKVARERGEELAQAVELTPFARLEFASAYEPDGDPLEQARRTLVRSFMGFGSAGASGQTTGFRANSNRSGTTPAHDWMNYPDCLRMVIQRLRGVVIEQRDALDVMKAHDGDDTVHYVDPPYVHDTRHHRTRAPAYRHELTDDQHRALASTLHELRGMVVLSGYRCPLYDELFADWRRVDVSAHADGAKDRTESLWLSSRCPQAGLFDMHNAELRGRPLADGPA